MLPTIETCPQKPCWAARFDETYCNRELLGECSNEVCYLIDRLTCVLFGRSSWLQLVYWYVACSGHVSSRTQGRSYMKSILWSLTVCLCVSIDGFCDPGVITTDDVGAAWNAREARLRAVDFQIRWRELEVEPQEEEQGGASPKHIFRVENARPEKISSSSNLLNSNGRIRLESSSVMVRRSTGRWEPSKVKTVWNRELGKSLFEFDDQVADNYGRVSKDLLKLVDMKLRAPFLGLWPSSPAYGHINLSDYEIGPQMPFINGSKCVMLLRKDRSPVETELYLDKAREYVVVRVIGRSGESVSRRIDIEYQDSEGLGSVPKSWKLKFWNTDLRKLELNINSIVTGVDKVSNIDDSMFDINFPAGTPIREFLEDSRGSRLHTAAKNVP